MKKSKLPISLLLIIAMSIFIFAGCKGKSNASETTDATGTTDDGPSFDYSGSIDDDGYWDGVKALKCVELCEYGNISVPSDVHVITDEALQTQIDIIMSDYATDEQITDRAAADGDTLNIDYVGSIDGVEFEGGSTDGAGTEVTIGVTSYIDDFIEQLIGHSPGESFDIEVTFPDDYGDEALNGKDAVFAITVNYIVETTTPELTDAFVSENLTADNGWTTVAEMKESISNDLKTDAVEEYLKKYITENSVISKLPDSLVTYQEDSMVFYYQEYADYYGIDIDEFLSTYVGVDSVETLLENYADSITEYATLFLVVQAIAEDLDISVSDEDVTAYFTRYVGSGDYSEYEDYYGMPYVRMIVLNQVVVDYLVEHAVLE